ncbi:MAG: sensor histidine kinase [Paenibacillaceae bacterium]|nr:sensor histidine kinase [Paenibacillaceae bacterium]
MSKFLYRLFWALMLFAVLPMILFASLGYRYLYSQTMWQSADVMNRQMNQVQKNMDNLTYKVVETYNRLYTGRTYTDVFISPDSIEERRKYEEFEQINFSFTQILPHNSEVILITQEGRLYLLDNPSIKFNADLAQYPGLQELYRDKYAGLHYVPREWYKDLFVRSEEIIVFEQNIVDISNQNFNWQGALFYIMPKADFADQIGLSGIEKGSTRVLDDSGQTVYASGQEAPIATFLPDTTSRTLAPLKQNPNVLVSTRALAHNWLVVNEISRGSIVVGLKETLGLLLLITASSIIVALLFAWFVSYRFTNPIARIVKGMKKMAAGNFEPIPIVKQTEELKIITESFNRMVQELKDHINEAYVWEIRDKEARLMALESQIDPHFLFNILESIRGQALENKDRHTADIIKKVAKLLRISLQADQPFIPLAQELKLVRDYLDIQTYRFGERLQTSIEFQDAEAECLVPRLIVQPIVENAVIHGLEKKVGTVCISIVITAVKNDLLIEVGDTGNGMNEQQLLATRERLSSRDFRQSSHIGLLNVHQRLQILYGPHYGVDIDSAEKRGTRVTLKLDRRIAEG